MIASVQVIIDANPLATLRQMKKDLEAKDPRMSSVSLYAISRPLDRMSTTMKFAEDISELGKKVISECTGSGKRES